jgi:hypothetical protein
MLDAIASGVEFLIVMVALLIAATLLLPAWPYSAKWGSLPAGICGVVAAGMAVLALLGRV